MNKVYHFVSTCEMKKNILIFSKLKKWNFSKTIRFILETVIPVIDYYTYFAEESNEFGYCEIGSELDIRFYIDNNLYRKLKNVHGSMHSFSIAVLVRKMINIFFQFVEEKGLKWFQNRMKIGSKNIIRFLHQKRSHKKQLRTVHMYGSEWGEEYISMIFSKNYNLLGVNIFKICLEDIKSKDIQYNRINIPDK